MSQLSLNLSALACLEYPDLYRGYRLVATQQPTQHCDRLGQYKAVTWQCHAYGEAKGIDGKVIASEHGTAQEAIAAGMQYLDIFVGRVESQHRFAEWYDAALKRVSQRLEQS